MFFKAAGCWCDPRKRRRQNTGEIKYSEHLNNILHLSSSSSCHLWATCRSFSFFVFTSSTLEISLDLKYAIMWWSSFLYSWGTNKTKLVWPHDSGIAIIDLGRISRTKKKQEARHAYRAKKKKNGRQQRLYSNVTAAQIEAARSSSSIDRRQLLEEEEKNKRPGEIRAPT